MKLICLGKTKQKFIKEGITEYKKRLSSYVKLQIEELADVRLSGTNTIDLVKQKEAEKLLRSINSKDFVVILDEQGKQMTSPELAEFLEEQSIHGGNLVFVIGGVYGLDKSVLNRADLVLSFSRFTFTHQMIRMILLEQLYRAFTIIKGKKYHY